MKIVVDPVGMKSAAGRMRTAVGELQSISGQVSCAALPEMPPAERALVEGRLRRAGSSLLSGGTALEGASRELDRRAKLAIVAAQGGGAPGPFGGPGLGSGLLNAILRNWKRDKSLVFFSRSAYRDGHSFGKRPANYRTPAGTRRPIGPFDPKDGTWKRSFKDGDPDKARAFGGAGMWKTWSGSSSWKSVKGKHGELAVGEAYAEGKVGIKRYDGKTWAEAGANVGVNAVRGSVGFKGKHVNGQVGGSIGANAKAGAGVGYGKQGVTAKASAGAFAGGEVHASGGVGAGGVSTKAQAGVSYGIGANAGGQVDVGLDKTRVKANIGATLGLGVNVGVDVTVKPKEVAKNVVVKPAKALIGLFK